jgi:peptidoglycan-associated lipoprotein
MLIAASLVVSGCAARKTRKQLEEEKAKAAAQKDSEAAYVPGVDVTEASLRGAEFGAVPELGVIRFDYDSALLKDENLAILKKNAQWLKEHKDQEVLVAGFCDDRGTIEYNLALGQKRAKEVREYYIRLGVPGKKVATISYGKENQVCSDSTDECWSKNRRAETRIRARMASNGHPKRDAQ